MPFWRQYFQVRFPGTSLADLEWCLCLLGKLYTRWIPTAVEPIQTTWLPSVPKVTDLSASVSDLSSPILRRHVLLLGFGGCMIGSKAKAGYGNQIFHCSHLLSFAVSESWLEQQGSTGRPLQSSISDAMLYFGTSSSVWTPPANVSGPDSASIFLLIFHSRSPICSWIWQE